jgi:hypothetical protein
MMPASLGTSWDFLKYGEGARPCGRRSPDGCTDT